MPQVALIKFLDGVYSRLNQIMVEISGKATQRAAKVAET